jgi:hypothetical protein
LEIHKTSSLAEIAAIVSDTLTKANIIAVLTGGGVVTVYSENEYQSDDLDFISPASSQKLEAAMSQIGFSKEGRYFIHPNTNYYVEFPPSPLMIGEQYIDYKECTVQKIGELELHILTPTLCVMDRLAGFYHWNDRQSLDQAVMVAKRHPIDFKRVKSWSTKEKKQKKYQDFLDRLQD